MHHISQGEINLLARLYREFFRALANPTRFAIVQLLRSEPHNVGQIGEKLGLEQSRVSHNLACLLNCGFVEWEWSGKNKVYRLNPDLGPVLTGIEKHLHRYAPALESCQVLECEAKQAVLPARSSGPRQSQRRRRGRSTVEA
jgi:DNA-binding transcriptional ArsR family regulator